MSPRRLDQRTLSRNRSNGIEASSPFQSRTSANAGTGIPHAANGADNVRHGGGVWLVLERWLLRELLQRFGNLPIRIVLRNGEELVTSNVPPVGRVTIRDRAALWHLLRNPSISFGDAYADGSIEIDGDLCECMEAIFRAMRNPQPTGLMGRLLQKLHPRSRRHTISDSRESVHHHYDLGNEFYKLWLDERMVYTCAYFPNPSMSLEQAQLAKMDHVCRKLRLAPGQSVVEAGCGWGALALHMASRYGVKVRAFNLGHEQITYAREQAEAAGLSGQVEFIEDDYRNIAGRYDVFVSVGMLEHVGPENYGALGRLIDRWLTASGRGLIHSIGRNAAQAMDPWTEKRIFPGAYAPSLREMMEIFEPFDFSVLDVENLRLHYARTLEHWLARYERAFNTVVDMFDEQFARTWRFYLASSVATFRTGDLQLFQVLFGRGTDNDIPWTRAYMDAAPQSEASGARAAAETLFQTLTGTAGVQHTGISPRASRSVKE